MSRVSRNRRAPGLKKGKRATTFVHTHRRAGVRVSVGATGAWPKPSTSLHKSTALCGSVQSSKAFYNELRPSTTLWSHAQPPSDGCQLCKLPRSHPWAKRDLQRPENTVVSINEGQLHHPTLAIPIFVGCHPPTYDAPPHTRTKHTCTSIDTLSRRH